MNLSKAATSGRWSIAPVAHFVSSPVRNSHQSLQHGFQKIASQNRWIVQKSTLVRFVEDS